MSFHNCPLSLTKKTNGSNVNDKTKLTKNALVKSNVMLAFYGTDSDESQQIVTERKQKQYGLSDQNCILNDIPESIDNNDDNGVLVPVTNVLSKPSSLSLSACMVDDNSDAVQHHQILTKSQWPKMAVNSFRKISADNDDDYHLQKPQPPPTCNDLMTYESIMELPAFITAAATNNDKDDYEDYWNDKLNYYNSKASMIHKQNICNNNNMTEKIMEQQCQQQRSSLASTATTIINQKSRSTLNMDIILAPNHDSTFRCDAHDNQTSSPSSLIISSPSSPTIIENNRFVADGNDDHHLFNTDITTKSYGSSHPPSTVIVDLVKTTLSSNKHLIGSRPQQQSEISTTSTSTTTESSIKQQQQNTPDAVVGVGDDLTACFSNRFGCQQRPTKFLDKIQYDDEGRNLLMQITANKLHSSHNNNDNKTNCLLNYQASSSLSSLLSKNESIVSTTSTIDDDRCFQTKLTTVSITPKFNEHQMGDVNDFSLLRDKQFVNFILPDLDKINDQSIHHQNYDLNSTHEYALTSEKTRFYYNFNNLGLYI